MCFFRYLPTKPDVSSPSSLVESAKASAISLGAFSPFYSSSLWNCSSTLALVNSSIFYYNFDFGGSAASCSLRASSIFYSTVFSGFFSFCARTLGFVVSFFFIGFVIFLVTFLPFWAFDFAFGVAFVFFFSLESFFLSVPYFFSFSLNSNSFSATFLLAEFIASSAFLYFFDGVSGFTSFSSGTSSSVLPYFFNSFSRSSCSAIVFSASLISSEYAFKAEVSWPFSCSSIASATACSPAKSINFYSFSAFSFLIFSYYAIFFFLAISASFLAFSLASASFYSLSAYIFAASSYSVKVISFSMAGSLFSSFDAESSYFSSLFSS